jgi:hypothetical protein
LLFFNCSFCWRPWSIVSWNGFCWCNHLPRASDQTVTVCLRSLLWYSAERTTAGNFGWQSCCQSVPGGIDREKRS